MRAALAGREAPFVDGTAELTVAAVEFGATASASLRTTFDRDVGAAERPRFACDGASASAAAWQGNAGELDLTYGAGNHTVTFVIGAARYRVVIVAPRDPPFVPGLDLVVGDNRTGDHFRLAAGPLATMRFLWLGDGLLVSATEVSRGEFRQFVDSGAWARLLAEDPRFVAWLARNRNSFELRGRWWSTELSPPELPVAMVHASEAVAFTRWIAAEAGLPAGAVRLPTSAEWRVVANRNSGRPDAVTGEFPFADAGAPEQIANCTTTTGAPSPDVDVGAFAALEPVWRRRQGALPLYHLGGNVAELCVDASDGVAPIAGTVRGGRLGRSCDEMRIPADDRAGAWRGGAAPEPAADVGFRLVIRIP